MFQLDISLVIAALTTALACGEPAQELGPAPTTGFGGASGRVSAVACSPTNPSLYYAAGADGGVWRTDDAGISWNPLTDSQATTAVGALALQPGSDQILYVGTGEGNFANHSRYGLGILKTTDGGAHWQQLAEPAFAGRCFSRIVIDPLTPSTLYAAVTRAGGFPALAAAKGHPGAGGPVGVFKSVDGGVGWSQLTGGLPGLDATDLAIDATTPSTLYAAIGYLFGSSANGIYKSIDSGATWTRLSTGLPAATYGRVGLACAPSNPQRLYATLMRPADSSGGSATLLGCFRSDNAGVTWNPISPGIDPSTYGWYFTTIGINPANADTVFFAAITTAYSTNAGSSFTSVGGAHPDFHAVAWDAAGRMVCGNDGGVYRSINGGAFVSLNQGLGTIQLYAGVSTSPSNPEVVLAGAQDNGTVLRSSPSLTWSAQVGGDGGWTQIDQSNPQRMFGESQGTGGLVRTDSGGGGWVFAGNGITGRNCFLPPYLLDGATPGRMLYGTERVWVSTNYGGAWTPLSADLTSGGVAAIRCLAMAPSDSRYVYAATNDGRVLASDTFGATFALIRSANPGWPRTTRELAVHPTQPTTIYLAGAAFGTAHVLRSTNMGGNWEPLDTGLPDIPVNVVGIDARSPVPTLYAGTDAGLYTSSTDGIAWRRVPGVPSTPVIDIVVEPSRSRLTLGTQGRGAWRVGAPAYCNADFNGDSDAGTDQDIQAFFACLAGTCCSTCGSSDFNNDGDAATDADIESFFRVLAGGAC